MSAPEPTPVMPLPVPEPEASRGFNSAGWLGSKSVFDPPDKRKLSTSVLISAGIHAAFFALLIWGAWRTAEAVTETPPEKLDVVFLESPGPGGGGGGSPAPAPVKKLEIPKVAPTPTPVAPTPVPVVPPPPELTAPVQTNAADLIQATGANAVSLAAYAGGGRGAGIGPGTGNGVGAGTGGGFGGGAYQPGNGIVNPELLRKIEPKYTSEAMRAKIQGEVELEAVVLANGTVGDIRVVRSLDRSFGLDDKAIEAARQWLFKPGTRTDPATKQAGPVPVIVRLILEFRLH
jgi:protein TonB